MQLIMMILTYIQNNQLLAREKGFSVGLRKYLIRFVAT